MVHHRELCDNYSAVGVRLNNHLLQYAFSQLWQFQNAALDHLHASSCFSPFQWGFILNGLNQKIELKSVIMWAPKRQ